MAEWSDLPQLVDAYGGGGGDHEVPPEAIRPRRFGAGTPYPRPAQLSGSRHTTPAAGFAGLARDDAGFSYPKHDFGSAPSGPEASILQHNPWLAGKSGGHHERPYRGTPYPGAAPMMDSDWPQHGQDFGMDPNYIMGSDAPKEAGFGEGGFGPQYFAGGFSGREEEDDTEPIIPAKPSGMSGPSPLIRSKSAHGHARSFSHSPGLAGQTFSDFGHAPPTGFGHTPMSAPMALAPNYDYDGWRRYNSSTGSTPQPAPTPLSAHNGYASGPRNHYKKPGDWRRDFVMPRKVGMGERLGLTRVLSIGKVFQGGAKSSPHRTLDGSNAASPACIWDVRLAPTTARLPSGQSFSYLELQEAAFSLPPKNGRIVLVHELLPWALTLTAGVTSLGTSTVVTVGHLLQTIHSELHRQIYESDFWNEAVGEGDRARIHQAWATRCSVLADVAVGEAQSRQREAKCREIASEGVKRVDFLGDRTLFYGLKRRPANGGGELWEMRFRKVEV